MRSHSPIFAAPVLPTNGAEGDSDGAVVEPLLTRVMSFSSCHCGGQVDAVRADDLLVWVQVPWDRQPPGGGGSVEIWNPVGIS